MANPSYWVFRRGQKWHSGWRDQNGDCHSKVHPFGAGKGLAHEYGRKMAVEASCIRAGQPIRGRLIQTALDEFLARQDVKECTHDLNRYHLEAVIAHGRLTTVDQITSDTIHHWLRHLKGKGCNPGGQSLSLRILRTFCRFCQKKGWLTISPFSDFKIPKSVFVGRYLNEDERGKLLSIDARYPVDEALNRALTFGLYSLLRISQVFHADWAHVRAPDQLWVPGIKGQDGRWIVLHPKALAAMGPRGEGRIFRYWETLDSFREAVYKKAQRVGLRGVRFHETKHTGISALLEAGYSIPEVCKISGNAYRTIAHYAHVNEQRVFEKWKAFDYQGDRNRTAAVQQEAAKVGANRAAAAPMEQQGENAKQLQIAMNSSV